MTLEEKLTKIKTTKEKITKLQESLELLESEVKEEIKEKSGGNINPNGIITIINNYPREIAYIKPMPFIPEPRWDLPIYLQSIGSSSNIGSFSSSYQQSNSCLSNIFNM